MSFAPAVIDNFNTNSGKIGPDIFPLGIKVSIIVPHTFQGAAEEVEKLNSFQKIKTDSDGGGSWPLNRPGCGFTAHVVGNIVKTWEMPIPESLKDKRHGKRPAAAMMRYWQRQVWEAVEGR